jgi:hypothetical protein
MSTTSEAAAAWNQRREDYESLVRAVFGTPAGHALLSYWRTHNLQAPTYAPGDDLAETAFVEGGKAFIRSIDAIVIPKRTP